MQDSQKCKLVLIHGFPFDSSMWNSVLSLLESRYHVVNLNLPGFGNRPSIPNGSIADWARDIEKQIREQNISEQVDLCGLSMGGYVALEFAAQFPSRLSRLILCDTKTTIDTSEARSVRLTMADRLASGDESVVQQTMHQLADDMPSKLLSATTINSDQQLVEEVKQMILSIPPATLAAAQRSMADRRDTTEVIRSLDCPVVGIVGSDDEITPTQLMRDIIQTAKRGHLEIIEQAGHLPPLEKPTNFVAAL